MERYSEYKDSGIFWNKTIPSHWEVRRLGHILVKERRERPVDAELLVCTNKATVVKKGDSKMGLVSDTDDIYQGVCKGDLLIHGMDTWHGAIAVSTLDGMCTPVVHVCTSKESVKYVEYYLRNMAQNKVFKLISNGVRQNTSDFRSWNKVAPIPCFLPPYEEQLSIVSYLDDKCGKIEKMLEGKQKQIELLTEMKQRIIADAVTRGLDPNVEMKTTNIPWLPEIPEHWGILRNKAFLKLTTEKVGSRKDFTLLSLTKQGVIIRDLSEGKGKFPKDFESYLVVRPNNLVFCLFDIDETPRTVGLVRNTGMLTGAYTNFEVNEEIVLPEYAYYYYLQIDDVKGLRPYYTGLRKVVKTNTFLQIRMPVPPMEEQIAIVSYVEKKCGCIDTLTSKLQQEIESIKEYKQRLISDVVTGQIKVC